MTSITLEPDVERRLGDLAKGTGRTAADFLREAILRGLEDLEDIRDADAVMARIQRGEERILTSEEVGRSLDLDD